MAGYVGAGQSVASVGFNDADKLNTGTVPVERIPYIGRRNIIINGDFRINQRGAASKTATSSAYNYDRWYYNGTDLEQRIEDVNYKPNTTYTLSGINVTTQQLTSPASGTWTINVPTNADEVQLEEGTVVTPFEQRSYGEELALCQRYYQVGNIYMPYGYTVYSTSYLMATRNHYTYPVTMRTTPTGTYQFISHDAAINHGVAFTGYQAVALATSGYVGAYASCTWVIQMDAEL